MPSLLSSTKPALEASYQSQIDDLVQRNRTLTHTNQKLSSQLDLEVSRSKEAISAIQAQHSGTQDEWKEAFEDVLGSYRIVQRRLEVEVERERMGLLMWGEEAVRRERVARLMWEYKVRLFMMREEEMERRVEEVEGEMRRVEEEYEGKIGKLKETCLDLLGRLKLEREAVSRLEKEVKEKDESLGKMREVQANLEAEKETFSGQLGRAKRSLELEKERRNELQEEFRKEKKRYQQLSNRIGECEDLEENVEREVARLKTKIAQLEREAAEAREKGDKGVAKLERDVEREKDKAGRLRTEKETWEKEAKALKKEAEKAASLVKKLEKKIEKMREDLEIERARVRPPVLISPLASSSQASPVPVVTRQVARKSTGGRPPPPLRIEEVEDEDEDEGPKKGKARVREDEEVEIADDEDEEPEPCKKKRKRKAPMTEMVEDDGSIEILEPPKAAKPKSRPRPIRKPKPTESKRGASQLRGTGGRGRSTSRQPSTLASTVDANDAEADAEEPQTKKKRKINIFPQVLLGADSGTASALASFTNANPTSSTLDIPTFLSPLKEDEPVPQRSSTAAGTSARAASTSSAFRFPSLGFTFGKR